MNRIADFFGTPQVQVRPIVQPQLARPVQNKRIVLEENVVNQGQQFVPHAVKQERLREADRPPVLVDNRNQDADQVVHQVRQENLVGKNNLAAMVEIKMVHNSVNMGL